MVGTSKILTVSYGTFSCTLEGFDDPFSTMKSIAEYFRDLASDDRYFGAEPPTPDAEMLHRIAEREIRKRVEARINRDGVVLRAAEADSAEPPESMAPETMAPDAAEIAGVTGVARGPSVRSPEPPREPQPDADAASALDSTPSAGEHVTDWEATAEPADLPPATVEETAEETAELDDYAEEIASAPAEPAAARPAARPAAPRPDLPPRIGAAAEPQPDDTSVVAKLERIRAAVARSRLVGDLTATPVEADEPATGTGTVDPALLSAILGNDAADAEQDVEAPAPVTETLTATDDDLADEEIAEEDIADEELAVDTGEAFLADADEEPAEDPAIDDEDEAAAEVEEDTPPQAPAASPLSPAGPEATSLSNLPRRLRPASEPVKLTPDDRVTLARKAIARYRLGAVDHDAEGQRLLAESENKLNEDDAARRRTAIAHLKAAVAATKADRGLTRVVSRDPALDPEEQVEYRSDLAKVVKNKSLTIEEKIAEAKAEMQAEGAATPLVLVSSLRIDAPEDEDDRMDRLDEALGVDEHTAGFASFAEEMGASGLPELLEAAAAYSTFVEGEPHFSRPQIMRRVAMIDPSLNHSREAGLRSFGQLLRQGKIQKLQRGQFTVSDDTRFRPGDRIAGE